MGEELPPLEPQSRRFAEQMRASAMPPPYELPYEKSRATMAASAILLSGPRTEVYRTEDRSIAGPGGALTIRIYWPRALQDGERIGGVLFLHGGGFYLGNIETHDVVARDLCRDAGVIVVSVDYRRAPEHRFPAAVEDCYAALCWLAGHGDEIGVDRDRIGVCGDSSGGTLTATTCLLARDRLGPKIACQVVVYGLLTLQDALYLPSRAEFGNGEYFGSLKDLEYVRNLYLADPDREASNPLASPLLAGDLSGLPPALVVTAGYDMVRDDNRYYADRLREAGVRVHYQCYADTLHPFYLFAGLLDIGRDARRFVADYVKRMLA